DLLAADNAAAKVGVSALPGLLDRSQLRGEPSPLSPIGASLDTAVPRDVPAVADGLARVQDEGSALVALALAEVDAPAGTWGDLCAGPGGKAAVLGAPAAQECQTLGLRFERAPGRTRPRLHPGSEQRHHSRT